MSPPGCQKMLATPCNQNAEESFPVHSLKSQAQKPPNPLLIQDKNILQPSPRPCTIRFDMVNTAVTKTRKYRARSSCPAANKASTSAGLSCVGQSVSFRA